jgi:uncharacterized membrane protein
MPSLLLLGESWTTHMIHQKGFDTFTSTEYVEGGAEFIAALRNGGWDVTHIPAHDIEAKCPRSAAEFGSYDVVAISDVGANSFLLTRAVFSQSRTEPNRLKALRDYVEGGGGLAMIGGYLSFSGIEGKANYANSPIGDILAVQALLTDDRAEIPEGATPQVTVPGHPALGATGENWPALLGYNRTSSLPDSDVLVEINGSPLVAVRTVKSGRSVVFTSDMSPHWAPPSFVAWDGYPTLWLALMSWAAGHSATNTR